MFRVIAQGLSKRFGQRKVFSRIDIDLDTGQSLAITGPNGSGKSTLIMTLLGLHHPTKGSVRYLQDDQPLDDAGRRKSLAFVAPYFNLYDQLSAEENLRFFTTMASVSIRGSRVNEVLERVGLQGRGDDLVLEYSSGMKQRLKYALALLLEPAFLFLDEPTANLDDRGKAVVRSIIDDARGDSIVVIATNEKEEIGLAEGECRLGE